MADDGWIGRWDCCLILPRHASVKGYLRRSFYTKICRTLSLGWLMFCDFFFFWVQLFFLPPMWLCMLFRLVSNSWSHLSLRSAGMTGMYPHTLQLLSSRELHGCSSAACGAADASCHPNWLWTLLCHSGRHCHRPRRPHISY